MKQRKVYLDNKPLQEALEEFFQALDHQNWGGDALEVIAVDDALGRITGKPLFARNSSPHYHASAMDGIAVKSERTYGASETTPVKLNIPEEAVVVDTGDPLPEGFDAVIMVEHLHPVGEHQVEIIAAAAPWQHVRPLGEDIVATEMILPANHLIGPYDIGALLAGGILEVEVKRIPKVAVIPTGTELVQPGGELKAGDIVEYNSRVLGALIQTWGGQPQRFPIVIDNYEQIKATVQKAVQDFDIVVVNAGSSAGTEDFTASVVAELGQLVCHGVAIKPGKPAILGIVQGKPVVGVPGYPVSAALTCETFVKPLITTRLGLELGRRQQVQALMSRKVTSPMGSEEFLRVKLGQVGEKIMATPMSRGAGVITSLVRADGLVTIPRLQEGLEAGQEVQVKLYRPIEEIRQTCVVIGSHDLTLDLIANQIKLKWPGWNLSSAHVGSLGGLMALRRGEAHMAGIHLLDEVTGEYNLAYLKKYLGETPAVLMNLVLRDQGLIVPKGNPKHIQGLEDLNRADVTFINRQRGSGTRVLLDYRLKQLGIDPERIKGYQREEFTHMTVAAAVAGGTADTGLGIYAAAQAIGLDFLPVGSERYDLLILGEYWETPHVQHLRALLNDESFRREVSGLGGYDVQLMGQILYSNL